MKEKLLVIVFIGFLLYVGFLLFHRDTWTATYYPQPDNLYVSSSSDRLSSLDECRTWVHMRSAGDRDYDYECGKNCMYDPKMDLNVCQETTR